MREDEESIIPELIRCEPAGLEIPAAEELLLATRANSRRLYLVLTAVLSVNLAVVSGVLTFWALAVWS